jgi:3-hydroxybutyryl-CoA dehydrogenase
MKIVVLANDAQWNYLQSLKTTCNFERVLSIIDFKQNNSADAYFNFEENAIAENYNFTNSPIIINSVIEPLTGTNLSSNVVRLNTWPGFIEADIWEVAGLISDNFKTIFTNLQKQYVQAPDEPGFISARIISMIINEAYFALENNVSTKDDIDIAMKLGTNYPYGPFEWANIIGEKNVFLLLKKLATSDERYKPSLALQNS